MNTEQEAWHEKISKTATKAISNWLHMRDCGLPFGTVGYGFEQALDEELFEDDEFFGIADYEPGLTYHLINS